MIELGAKIKDTVTGLTGIAICRVEYLNGCIQYGLKPPITKDGTSRDCEYIDEGQLIEVGPKKKPAPKTLRRTGGPSTDTPGKAGDLPNDDYHGGGDDNWATR